MMNCPVYTGCDEFPKCGHESEYIDIDFDETLLRIDQALTQYRRRGPSVSIAIDLAFSLREARDLITHPAYVPTATAVVYRNLSSTTGLAAIKGA